MKTKKVTILKAGGSLSPEKAREILHDGTANGHPLTPKQRRFMGWKASKANNGLSIEGDQYTPISSSTLMLGGKKHKNGGTDIAYNGQQVEAESGEPIFLDDDGSLVVAGNMKNPITGRKFKSDTKIIGEKEAKMDVLLDKGNALVNDSDPYDKWDVLKFNAGRAMSIGAHRKKQELEESKNHLAEIQDAMLEKSDELGVDPEAFSKGYLKKAKYGARIAQNGASLAVRNNNPGNIKYGDFAKKYGAIKGQPATDGGWFAVFPSVQQGQQAMVGLLNNKSYKNKEVTEAIYDWTGHSPYKIIPDNLKGKKIKDLNQNEFKSLLNTITQGEDSKLYNWDNVNVPSTPNDNTLPPITLTTIGRLRAPKVQPSVPQSFRKVSRGPNYGFNYNEPESTPVPTNTENLNFLQVMPEIYAAATNKPEPVFAQKYSPNLYQPYSVSFQDRRNLNTQTFRELSQRLSDNPEALSTLAAQKYAADNQVNAEEFRTNQAIANDITNKNIQLLNDAELKNLSIADTQYVRQSQAKSKTKAVNQAVLNSISGKLMQNRLENRQIQVQENLYPDYRYDENYQLQKVGDSGFSQLNFGSPELSPINNDNSSLRINRDRTGNIISTSESIPSQIDQNMKNLRYQRSLGQMLNSRDFMFDAKTKSLKKRNSGYNYSPLKGYDYSK